MSIVAKRLDGSICYLYVGRPRPRRHCVRWGLSFPTPTERGTAAPTFRPMSIVAKRLDGSGYHLVRRSASAQGQCVREDQLPRGNMHSSPHFSVHVYCDQTSGWIKMPVGTEIGLGPGDIVLDGDAARPHGKGQSSPLLFGPCLF